MENKKKIMAISFIEESMYDTDKFRYLEELKQANEINKLNIINAYNAAKYSIKTAEEYFNENYNGQ